MACHHQPVDPRFDHEAILRDVEKSETMQGNRQRDALAGTGGQMDPGESHQSAGRPLHRLARGLQIDLQHLRRRHGAAVGNADGQGDGRLSIV